MRCPRIVLATATRAVECGEPCTVAAQTTLRGDTAGALKTYRCKAGHVWTAW